MQTSEKIDLIATALAKAQAVMAGAKKDATNPHFRSKYADLASVWEACRSALTDNGIAVVQMTKWTEREEVIVETRLCHTSGQWMEGVIAIPVSKADAQGYGSALTYARRYGLSAAVGIAPEDDDGNAAAAAKPLPAAIPANSEGIATFAAMSADEQAFLREKAMELIALAESDQGDVVSYLEGLHLQTEEKLALWSQLPSKVRAYIKKAQEADRASKPKHPPAYAMQA